ncbi:MAG: dihydrofolate reductase [Methylococcales bacterium]
MKISLIAAVSANNVIGFKGRLPWHLPEDLQNFKRLTMGKPILMGRKTFDSLARALPGRTNIVITRNPNYRPEGCKIFSNINDALQTFSDCVELMVIGGASFYEQMLPLAETLYLTEIKENFNGDTFFPTIDISKWIEHSKQDFRQLKIPYLKYSLKVYHKNSST